MIDLREYASLIRSLAKEANERDENWKWSVRKIGKMTADIYWEYLDYCEEPNPCFRIEVEDTGDGYWIKAKDEHGHTIRSEIITDNDCPFLNTPVDEAIKKLFRAVFRVADNCY